MMDSGPWVHESYDAVVLGGGCAGLSAAIDLSEAGYHVLVIERKRMPGGRASSFPEKVTQDVLDNGQHLMLGAYTHTLAYLQKVGSDHELLALDPIETPIYGPGLPAKLNVAKLPGPLGLLVALLRFKALPLSDRLKFLRLPLILAHKDLSSISAKTWISRLGQSDIAYQRFWEILILATLNADPAAISADMLAVVLRDGFMSSADLSRPLLSRVGLSDLFGYPAQRYVEARGGRIVYQQVAQRLLSNSDRVQGVELLSEEVLKARCVISALPPNFMAQLCERSSPELAAFSHPARSLVASPILSVNLWTSDILFEVPYVGLWGSHFHWAFRKDRYFKSLKSPHYTFVASAATSFLSKTKDELLTMVLNDCERCLGQRPQVTHMTLSWEKMATWVAPLGQPHGHMDQRTPWKNFFLCGDWTNTGLPGTIESAVKSGSLAAMHAKTYLATA